jgi:hypothetical protein
MASVARRRSRLEQRVLSLQSTVTQPARSRTLGAYMAQ